MQSPEQAVANAIVVQAAEDYRNALRGKSYCKKLTPEAVIKEVENFFRSNWYRLFTKVDADYLLEKLRKEHLERSRNESNTDTINTEPNRNDSYDSIDML